MWSGPRGRTEARRGRAEGGAPNLRRPGGGGEAAPERGAQRGNKEEPGWGRALPGCRVTGLPGKAPAEPPEEEPLPRSRRGRAAGAPGPQSPTNGGHQVRSPLSRTEAAGLRRRDPGLDGQSAEIMTRGGFTAPAPRPPLAPCHWLRCCKEGEGQEADRR